jgi:hypothetical protein
MQSQNTEYELRAVRQEFANRFYQWQFGDARRENGADFPHVRRVKNHVVQSFLQMVEPMEEGDRVQLMTALVKRTHNQGLAHVAETITPHEESLIQRFKEYARDGSMARGSSAPDRKEDSRRQARGRARSVEIDRKLLHKEIVGAFRDQCGSSMKQHGAGESYFDSVLGSWSVRTEICTRSRFCHFDYFQRVMTTRGLIVGEGISLLHWLGLAGSQTQWILEGQSQVPDAVDALKNICAHFIREAAPLLQGFEPPKGLQR